MAKEALITAEYLRSILDYDPSTGVFTWRWRDDVRPRWNKTYAGKIAGCRRKEGYLAIYILDKPYFAHRLAWLYMMGEWPKGQIDHSDNDKTNNKFNNIRLASVAQNCFNKGVTKNNTSGIKGVSWSATSRKWRVSIADFGKHRHIGMFETKEEAAKAYAAAADKYHGEFARTG